MGTLKTLLGRIVQGEELDEAEAQSVLGLVMDGEATDAQIGALLTGLRIRGEAVSELTGAVRAMRERMTAVQLSEGPVLDTCGTGGDGAGTFNVSTATAFVCAAAGARVAKHGNRAVSSRVGSADVLEALGVHIGLGPAAVAQCIETVGIGFLFAPAHHSALRHAGPARTQLGFRTILNLLGPMTNPAHATHQLIGVFSPRWLRPVAEVLGRLGSQAALVVHGPEGLDELGISGPTQAASLQQGTVSEFLIDPAELGIPSAALSELAGGSAEQNASMVREALAGTPGPAFDIVRLNAGAALWIAELSATLAHGVELATAVCQRGEAISKLNALTALSQRLGSGEL